MPVLRIALLVFFGACIVAGVLLGYFTQGGSPWLAVAVATGLLIPYVVLGWYAGKWGEQAGREWRAARSRKRPE